MIINGKTPSSSHQAKRLVPVTGLYMWGIERFTHAPKKINHKPQKQSLGV